MHCTSQDSYSIHSRRIINHTNHIRCLERIRIRSNFGENIFARKFFDKLIHECLIYLRLQLHRNSYSDCKYWKWFHMKISSRALPILLLTPSNRIDKYDYSAHISHNTILLIAVFASVSFKFTDKFRVMPNRLNQLTLLFQISKECEIFL